MSGLFQRAMRLLRRAPELSPGEEIIFDEESGISKEDQKEIIAAIDKVARESRIAVTPEVLKIQAQKRGTLFPLLVNILSAVLLAGGGSAFYFLFQRDESGLRQEGAALTTAEGRLIQELKKESEARLLEKSREISRIQNRLQEIDRERRDLQANMDARVAAREAELRRAVEQELAAERRKLAREGFSEADITRRLQELDKRRTDAFQRELAAFRRQAEEERRKAETSLAALQAEYQASLAQAGRERARVLEEARRREEELRSQLALRAQALERETQEARRELSRAAEQREKEELAAGQLVGFYTRLKEHMAAERFEQALGDLAAIREFLDDPGIAALPGLLRRRDVELFVADSIGELVRAEMRKGQPDSASLIAAAGAVTELRSRVLQADGLYRQGEVEKAENLYREALALIPEVNRAHEHFQARTQEAEAARAARLRENLRRAESAFAGGDHEASLAHYTRALEYLPEEPAAVEGLIARVRQSGYQLELPRLRRTLEEKEREIAGLRGRLESSSAEAGELRRALERKTREAAALQAELEKTESEAAARQSGLDERLGKLQEDLAGRVALIEGLQAEKRSLETETAALRRKVEELEKAQAAQEAQAARQSQRDAQAREARTRQEAERQGAETARRMQELAAAVERLEKVEARYNRLTGSYRDYVAREDALLAARGSTALIESKLHLNAFLSSAEDVFPGLWDRIRRYDEAFRSAGRAGAMREIADILYELSFADGPEARRRLLEAEAGRYPDDPLMQRFLAELQELPPGRPPG